MYVGQQSKRLRTKCHLLDPSTQCRLLRCDFWSGYCIRKEKSELQSLRQWINNFFLVRFELRDEHESSRGVARPILSPFSSPIFSHLLAGGALTREGSGDMGFSNLAVWKQRNLERKLKCSRGLLNSCDERRLITEYLGGNPPNFSHSRLNTCRCRNKTVFCWLIFSAKKAANNRKFKNCLSF